MNIISNKIGITFCGRIWIALNVNNDTNKVNIIKSTLK